MINRNSKIAKIVIWTAKIFGTAALVVITTSCGGEFSPSNGVSIVSSTSTPVAAQPTTKPQSTTAQRYTTPAYTSPAYVPPPPPAAPWPSSAVWMRSAHSLDNLPGNVHRAFNGDGGSVALVCANPESSREAYGPFKVRGYDFELIDFNDNPPGEVRLRFYGDTRMFDDLTVILTTYNVPGDGTSQRCGDSTTVITAADFDTSNEVAIKSSMYNPDGYSYPMVQEVRACT